MPHIYPSLPARSRNISLPLINPYYVLDKQALGAFSTTDTTHNNNLETTIPDDTNPFSRHGLLRIILGVH